MNSYAKIFLKTLGVIFLAVAAFHVAGYAFGWTEYRSEDKYPMIIGGICGGAGAFVVSLRNARRQAAARPH